MTISGYNIHNAKLNHWHLLLREWIQCFERLCDFTGTTPGWSEPEDSNKGPFAGAIWRLGWVAFPEVRCRRTSLGGYGKIDFYLADQALDITAYRSPKFGVKLKIALSSGNERHPAHYHRARR